MATSPLISIITITYNAGGVLPPTMESVKEQSFTDYEHLIIDGASSDHTLEIARSLGGESLRILSEPDKGLYDAMNKGLRMAKGKYVLFLNAGDAFHSRDVLNAYGEAALHNADIIYADTVIVDSQRNVIAPRHLSAPSILSFHSFSQGMLVCHQAFMVKRSLAPEYDLRFRFSADYDWTVKCLQKTKPGNCINLNMVAIDYLTDGTTDKNKLTSLRERFRIMCEHYGTFPTIINHLGFMLRAAKRKL
ncbi:MAG: glycosyltransferase [Bacteroides sp.]|nr:glycosyltransferase [Bacteroides sp.]